MATEFVAPDFVQNNGPEYIQQRMMANLPPDIDDMPGGFPYDFTMPTALEKSELIQFHLVRTLMLMFHMWAWGEWLDYHGKQAGVARNAANKASGHVTIEGVAGTRIASGFVVCTPATDDEASIEFVLDEEVILDDTGLSDVKITAVLAGTKPNVKSGTVTLMSQPIEGIIKINNRQEITGGTDDESDASYLERITEKYASSDVSYIGNDSDYVRWAKEVDGIGDCIVVPAWSGPGTVKLVLVDSNGRPANDQLVQAVHDHILSPNDREKRLMPTGSAELTVVSASTKMISYSCANISYDNSTDLNTITTSFKIAIMKYYAEAKLDGIVKYNKAHAILTNLQGVLDFEGFLINGDKQNILLAQDEYPETDGVGFS